MSRHCSAATKTGRPCHAWAIKDSDPPLCSIHAKTTVGGAPAGNQNRHTHGFYTTAYTLAELRDLLHITQEPGIHEEIAAARIALRRVLAYLQSNPDLDSDQYRATINLIFTGAGTVARLARTQHLLGGGAKDTLLDAFAEAMDQISDDLPIQL